jgi:hypothetical protein
MAVIESEVELIDYLRIMWRRKWIIVGIVVVAAAIAAVGVATRPVQYSGVATYELSESLSYFVRDCAPALSGDECAAMPAIGMIVGDIAATVAGPGMQVSASASGARVRVLVSGAESKAALSEAFESLATTMRERYLTSVRAIISRALAAQESRIAQGVSARAHLAQRIEGADVVSVSSLAEALAERLSELDLEQARDEGRLEALRQANPGALFALDIVVPLSISEARPSLRLILPIAVVLGLFSGILVAFFVNYLAEERGRGSNRPQVSAPKAH